MGELIEQRLGPSIRRVKGDMNPEEAITSICVKTFYFACLHDEELAQSTQLQRDTHKTDVKEEEAML